MSRRLAREKALQIIFQIDVGKIQPEFAINNILEEAELSAPDAEFTKTLVKGVLANLDTLDRQIEKFSIDWEIKRMANVDRNLLRLAIYEMLFLAEEIPRNVSINEAVELAKIFSSPEAGKFVNGILDQVKKQLETSKPGEAHV
ncbi:transcription antitermination factor NusB [Zhaonella formicivorans]|uniref:transcription antitermination factor NusB n=1 Tax=Zhaonella formicivorans TaxID=2528593 RepID=UPI0010E1C338|nr:transcription antitermination factor NusB [Zhaonella formicivorans]